MLCHPLRVLTQVAAILSSLALAATAGHSQPARGDTDGHANLVLTNAQLVIIGSGEVRAGTTIAIDGGIVTAVVQDGTLPFNTTSQVIDLNGAFVVPGLWDAHVHVAGNPEFARSRQFAAFAAHGVTAVRDMGATTPSLVDLRAAMAEPASAAPAPRLIASGPLIDGTRQPWYDDLQQVVEDPAAIGPLLDEIDRAGADFYKAYSALSPDVYAALLREADLRGKAVDGHVPFAVGLAGVAAGSQRTIEHLDIASLRSCADQEVDWVTEAARAKFAEGWDSYYRVLARFDASIDWTKCRAALQRFAERGGAVTPTLIMEAWSPADVSAATLALLEPSAREYCEAQLAALGQASETSRRSAADFLRRGMAELKAAGVVILAGTDLPNYCNAAGATLLRELELLVEFGLTPREAMAAATTAPARLFLGRSGEIEPGAPADLLILGANPLESIAALHDRRGLVAAGRWLDRSMLAELMRKASEPFAAPIEETSAR